MRLKNLNLQIQDKLEMELFLGLLSLGICTSLKENLIDIECAERILYSPYMMEKLKKFQLSSKVIDLINQGTELEDIRSLIPEKLETQFQDMVSISREIIEKNGKVNLSDSRWF